MGDISQEVISACNTILCTCHLLDNEQANLLRAAIEKKYARTLNKSLPLWERLASGNSLHDAFGWQHIYRYVSGPLILFFDDSRDDCMVFVDNGSKISNIIAECTGFTFYVTNKTLDYLICFNDHDVLIGTGAAADWVREAQVKPYDHL